MNYNTTRRLCELRLLFIRVFYYYIHLIFSISIVDDDTLVPLHDDEAELEEDLRPTEELHTIGDYVDERPTSVRELDIALLARSRWR